MCPVRLRERDEWKFFSVLPKADRPLATAWWAIVVLRGGLPAVFAIAMGALVTAVQQNSGFAAPLTFVGDKTAAWLYDRLTAACIRPPGMGHLEDPKLTADLTVARD